MDLDQISKARTTDKDKAKQEKEATERVLDLLAAAAGQSINENNAINWHPESIIPSVLSVREGESLPGVAKWLNSYIISQEAEMVFELPPTIKCRPGDGAVAVNDLLKHIWGMASKGLPQQTMFGTKPPTETSVQVGPNEYRSVPWDLIDFPKLEGEMFLGQKIDPTYGPLFHAWVKCPKKYKNQMDGFWKLLEQWLKENSIYKGKALRGVGKVDSQGNFDHPEFLEPYAVDPNKVAYNQEVFEGLRASVWGPIRTASLQRAAGLKLNRKTLLFGGYGGGKSLAGALTSRTAVNNGWTFIQAKTGEEDLGKVLKTAELYAPAVVMIEDIDTLIDNDPKEMSKLLEMFDGVSSKNKEVMVLMTSNHVEAMSKGMMRVGRIDSALEIGHPDTTSIRRLLKANFEVMEPYANDEDHGVYEAMSKQISATDLIMPTGTLLADDIDFEAIYEAMADYETAFIMGTFNLAKSNAIIRSESLQFKLTTEDFVIAANTLRSQHDTHRNAADRPTVETVGVAFSDLVRQAVRGELGGHRVDFQNQGELIAVE